MKSKNFKKDLTKMSKRELLDYFSASPDDFVVSNKRLILECLEIEPQCFQYLYHLYKNDKEVVFQAVKSGYGKALSFCPILMKDEKFVIKVIKDAIECKEIHKTLKENKLLTHKESLALIDRDPYIWREMDPDLRKHPDILTELLGTNPIAFHDCLNGFNVNQSDRNLFFKIIWTGFKSRKEDYFLNALRQFEKKLKPENDSWYAYDWNKHDYLLDMLFSGITGKELRKIEKGNLLKYNYTKKKLVEELKKHEILEMELKPEITNNSKQIKKSRKQTP